MFSPMEKTHLKAILKSGIKQKEKNYMKTTFLRILLCISALFPINAFAQEIPQISNFMNNQLIFNPAAAGMYETEFNANALARLQWSGIKGAPVYNMFWADYRFDGDKSAIGININNQSYGITKATDLFANYGYTLRLNERFKLAMGLRVGATFYKYTDLPADKIWDPNDPNAVNPYSNQTIPVAGGGLRIYDKKMYLGLSAPDLIALDKNNVYQENGRSFFDKGRNYSAMGGYKLQLSEAYALSPNVMLYYYPHKTTRTDVNLNFEIRDYFWAGATYSSSHYHSVMVGTHVSSVFRASYAFQFPAGSDVPSKFYTHEISLMLNLDVRKK